MNAWGGVGLRTSNACARRCMWPPPGAVTLLPFAILPQPFSGLPSCVFGTQPGVPAPGATPRGWRAQQQCGACTQASRGGGAHGGAGGGAGEHGLRCAGCFRVRNVGAPWLISSRSDGLWTARTAAARLGCRAIRAGCAVAAGSYNEAEAALLAAQRQSSQPKQCFHRSQRPVKR